MRRAYAFLQRAHLYTKAADPKRALRDLRHCLHASPSAEIFGHAAKVFRALGYDDKAERLLGYARAQQVRTDASTFFDLPAEIVLQVLKQLPFTSLLQCMGVCKQWHTFIVHHPTLWHSIHIRAAPSHVPLDVALAHQKHVFTTFVHRGKSCVRSVSLSTPFSEQKYGLQRLSLLPLTHLRVASRHANDWYVWAMQQPHLQSLWIGPHTEAQKCDSFNTNPILSSTVPACQLRHLTIIRSGMHTQCQALVRACDHLATFVHDVGHSLTALDEMHAKYGRLPRMLVRHAHATLERVEVRGKAAWSGLFRASEGEDGVLFPRLRSFHAPLSLLGRVAAWPALHSFEFQVPSARSDAQAPLLSLAQAAQHTLEVLSIRLTTTSDAHLVRAMLQLCTNIHTLYVVLDEYGPAPPVMLWPSWETAAAYALTPGLLVHLLTPGMFSMPGDVYCPGLRHLSLQDANTVHGRELLNMVHVRACLAQSRTLSEAWDGIKGRACNLPNTHFSCESITLLDIDMCMDVSEQAVQYLRQRVDVAWQAHSAERTEMFIGRRERTFRARFQ